jgi:hypothetical protein
MKPIWEKLQYLSTMTMPEYAGNTGYHGTLVLFRLGDLYRGTDDMGKLAFISSLSYTMMDSTPWELDFSSEGGADRIGELPMGVSVQIGLTILDDVQPALASKVYDWTFDTTTELQATIKEAAIEAQNEQEALDDFYDYTGPDPNANVA